MKSILVYSFRTNKYLDRFQNEGIEIFVFGKLKEDLKKFEEHIEKLRPKIIIGLASIQTQSRLETVAVNCFGKKGKVSRFGKESYNMYTQVQLPFLKSRQPSRSFCNWTMYQIAERVNTKNINFSFIHFNHNDLETVIPFIKNTERTSYPSK